MPQNKNFMESIQFVTSDGQVHGPFGKIFQLVRWGPKSQPVCHFVSGQYLYIYMYIDECNGRTFI